MFRAGLKSTRPPLAVHWLELAETGCAGIPRARPQCARWVRPHPPAGGPSGRRGLRPWAQTFPSTCTQSVLHSLGRGPDGTPGGLLTSPAVTSPPLAGPGRRAVRRPTPGWAGWAWARAGPNRPNYDKPEPSKARLYKGWGRGASSGASRAEENRRRPAKSAKWSLQI